MELNVLYNVHHELAIGTLIAIYFYFVGLHAGCSIVSITATLIGKDEYKPVAKIGAIAVIILFSIAPIFLIVDLEQPLRFWYLFIRFNPSSPISWGTFFLIAYPIATTIYIIYLFMDNIPMSKLWGAISLPLAIGVHGYTGFILGMGKARVLWNTAIMPGYFLSSAMVSGIALMIIIAIIRHYVIRGRLSPEQRETDFTLIIRLTQAMAAFIAVNLFYVFSDIVIMYTHTEDAYVTVELVRFGKFGFLYMWVDNFLGNAIPLAVVLTPWVRKHLPTLAFVSLLALVGVYVMRYVLVIGGQYIPQT
ncbi:MAG: NrfD/PsrC family molybdoenzyme membrane anchor subunit [Candidatus Binatia bacterium]